jgi:hypothetical protein
MSFPSYLRTGIHTPRTGRKPHHSAADDRRATLISQ